MATSTHWAPVGGPPAPSVNDRMEGSRRDCKSCDAPPPEKKAAKRRQRQEPGSTSRCSFIGPRQCCVRCQPHTIGCGRCNTSGGITKRPQYLALSRLCEVLPTRRGSYAKSSIRYGVQRYAYKIAAHKHRREQNGLRLQFVVRHLITCLFLGCGADSWLVDSQSTSGNARWNTIGQLGLSRPAAAPFSASWAQCTMPWTSVVHARAHTPHWHDDPSWSCAWSSSRSHKGFHSGTVRGVMHSMHFDKVKQRIQEVGGRKGKRKSLDWRLFLLVAHVVLCARVASHYLWHWRLHVARLTQWQATQCAASNKLFYPHPKDPVILKILRSYQFTTVVAKKYDGAKTLWQTPGRVSETPCFPAKVHRRSPQIMN